MVWFVKNKEAKDFNILHPLFYFPKRFTNCSLQQMSNYNLDTMATRRCVVTMTDITVFSFFFFLCGKLLNPAAAPSHRQHGRLYVGADRWLIDITLTVQRGPLACVCRETFLTCLFTKAQSGRRGVGGGLILENECRLDRGGEADQHFLLALLSTSLFWYGFLIRSCWEDGVTAHCLWRVWFISVWHGPK